VLCKTKDGSGLPKVDRSVDHPDIWWKGRDESRRLSGGETYTDPQGGYPSSCRWIDGGSGPKSVSGSSWMNSELGEYGKDKGDLRLVQAPGE
jgi:hypothetical protein